MCGRYGWIEAPGGLVRALGFRDRASEQRLLEKLEELDPPLAPRFNAAPTTSGLILVRGEVGDLEPRYARWGLIPHWVKDPAAFRATLFNARSETAHEKPSFREAFKTRRCIVPVSGFYEWCIVGAGSPKQPYWVRRRDGAPLFLGGVFAENPRVEPAASYAILTTRPGALLARLHDREPVRIPVPLLERWLDPGVRDAASLTDFLEPGDPGDLEAVPVSKAVNRVGVDEPSLLEPVGTPLQVSC